MIEPEIAFADLAADADLAEALLKYLFKARARTSAATTWSSSPSASTKTAIARLENFVASPFERIDYTDAVEILRADAARRSSSRSKWGMDLQTEHERFLVEEHVGRPVVVMNYPKQIKAFYMRLNDDGKTVAAMDVLAPGHRRDHRRHASAKSASTVLDARIGEDAPRARQHYWWYRDLRRYGTVPHAGFGLGFERLVVYTCGMANIRDVIPYPARRGTRSSDVLFALLLALGFAIFGLTAYVMSWPLVATQLRDRHPQDRPLKGATPFSPRAFGWFLLRFACGARQPIRTCVLPPSPGSVAAWAIAIGGACAAVLLLLRITGVMV